MHDWTPEDLKQNLDGGENVFLKLWKNGCGICKLSTPATDRLEQDNPHGLVFAKINVSDHPEMMELADTEVLPAFFVFKDQKLKGKFIGFKGLAKLKEFVDDSVKS